MDWYMVVKKVCLPSTLISSYIMLNYKFLYPLCNHHDTQFNLHAVTNWTEKHLPGGIGRSLIPFLGGVLRLLTTGSGLGERLGGESILSKSLCRIPGGIGRLVKLFGFSTGGATSATAGLLTSTSTFTGFGLMGTGSLTDGFTTGGSWSICMTSGALFVT